MTELKQGTSHEVIDTNTRALVTGGMDLKSARSIAFREAGREAMDFQDVGAVSAREVHEKTGYLLIRDNPIIKAGVFQYKGSSIGHDADPNQIYNVYRPIEEITHPDTLKSLVGLPIIDEHEMVGGKYARGPEERGVHGAILENIRAVGLDLLAPISIFSRTLKALIDAGKRGLSLGYNCAFEKSSGVFEGMTYNYIQRGIRGNHLALVNQGRNGTAVLDEQDVLDEFDLALDTGENTMADDDKKPDDAKDSLKQDEKPKLELTAVHAYLKENAPMWAELQALMGAGATEGDSALDADTDKKDGDQKAEDADDDKKDDDKGEKKEAMDANDITALIDQRLGAQRKSFIKTMGGEITARDNLAKSLVPHIGTFACDGMDADEVAAYGAEKLGLTVKKGHEQSAVTAFLAGAEKNKGGANFAMDNAIAKPKTDGKLGQRLSKASA